MTDRLQQAIKKARAERQNLAAVAPPSDSTAEQALDVVQSSTPEQRPPSADQSVPDVWHQLKPLIMSNKSVVRNRLVAHSSGEQAIPFDMLRTKILQQSKKNNWRRIGIVSPGSGCGKSTISANLGFSFSRMSELRTIIMDFDFRRLGLGKTLGQTAKYGMPEVLKGQVPFSDAACCLDGNVAFGLNSRKSENPSEILQSQKAVEVLDEIENTYQPDIMLFDTPPLMANDDSHGFLRSVDCALLVVVAEQTPIEQIDVAERQLAELTNVMGIVLNRCRYTSGAHGYENEYY